MDDLLFYKFGSLVGMGYGSTMNLECSHKSAFKFSFSVAGSEFSVQREGGAVIRRTLGGPGLLIFRAVGVDGTTEEIQAAGAGALMQGLALVFGEDAAAEAAAGGEMKVYHYDNGDGLTYVDIPEAHSIAVITEPGLVGATTTVVIPSPISLESVGREIILINHTNGNLSVSEDLYSPDGTADFVVTPKTTARIVSDGYLWHIVSTLN